MVLELSNADNNSDRKKVLKLSKITQKWDIQFLQVQIIRLIWCPSQQ